MLTGWWVQGVLETGGAALLLSWVVGVIGSIVLHELAHGWTAIRLGDRTPIETGHMTWNPLVHLGTFSMIVFVLFGIAWGAMPVDPSRVRGRYGDVLVTLAGPLMNVCLAALAIVLGGLWEAMAEGMGVGRPLRGNAADFFFIAAMLNIFLAIFNLLPIVPLDGGRIVSRFSRAYAELAGNEQGQWLMLGVFLLFFWFGADPIFALARAIAQSGIGGIAGAIGGG